MAPTATATLEARNQEAAKKFRKSIVPYASSCLSSACSCLVTPSTIYRTSTKTGKPVTRTTQPIVHRTSTGTRTITVTQNVGSDVPTVETITKACVPEESIKASHPD